MHTQLLHLVSTGKHTHIIAHSGEHKHSSDERGVEGFLTAEDFFYFCFNEGLPDDERERDALS